MIPCFWIYHRRVRNQCQCFIRYQRLLNRMVDRPLSMIRKIAKITNRPRRPHQYQQHRWPVPWQSCRPTMAAAVAPLQRQSMIHTIRTPNCHRPTKILHFIETNVVWFHRHLAANAQSHPNIITLQTAVRIFPSHIHTHSLTSFSHEFSPRLFI